MAKAPIEIRSLARTHTKEALETLAEINKDKKAPHAARVAAANSLLDRGWGKAVQFVEAETTVRYVADLPNVAHDTDEWQKQHAPTIQ